jgi:hypothetical protein
MMGKFPGFTYPAVGDRYDQTLKQQPTKRGVKGLSGKNRLGNIIGDSALISVSVKKHSVTHGRTLWADWTTKLP